MNSLDYGTRSPRLARWFADYASCHQTKGNQITHYFGIPMIMTAILGLLARLQFGPEGASIWMTIDGGKILWLVASLWYLTLDAGLALPFILVSALLYVAGIGLSVPVLWGLFIVGWIFQFIGHIVYEKESPAFFRNILQLLIGPLWIFSKVLRGARRPARSS
ncbi:MAG: DUF962 domain-containing protein [Planctomycetota bacterium]|nr:MAG: DUF962 domain-containing protein [Planctomycetota bacterium]